MASQTRKAMLELIQRAASEEIARKQESEHESRMAEETARRREQEAREAMAAAAMQKTETTETTTAWSTMLLTRTSRPAHRG